jgi:hypothetical protein
MATTSGLAKRVDGREISLIGFTCQPARAHNVNFQSLSRTAEEEAKQQIVNDTGAK